MWWTFYHTYIELWNVRLFGGAVKVFGGLDTHKSHPICAYAFYNHAL